MDTQPAVNLLGSQPQPNCDMPNVKRCLLAPEPVRLNGSKKRATNADAVEVLPRLQLLPATRLPGLRMQLPLLSPFQSQSSTPGQGPAQASEAQATHPSSHRSVAPNYSLLGQCTAAPPVRAAGQVYLIPAVTRPPSGSSQSNGLAKPAAVAAVDPERAAAKRASGRVPSVRAPVGKHRVHSSPGSQIRTTSFQTRAASPGAGVLGPGVPPGHAACLLAGNSGGGLPPRSSLLGAKRARREAGEPGAAGSGGRPAQEPKEVGAARCDGAMDWLAAEDGTGNNVCGSTVASVQSSPVRSSTEQQSGSETAVAQRFPGAAMGPAADSTSSAPAPAATGLVLGPAPGRSVPGAGSTPHVQSHSSAPCCPWGTNSSGPVASIPDGEPAPSPQREHAVTAPPSTSSDNDQPLSAQPHVPSDAQSSDACGPAPASQGPAVPGMPANAPTGLSALQRPPGRITARTLAKGTLPMPASLEYTAVWAGSSEAAIRVAAVCCPPRALPRVGHSKATCRLEARLARMLWPRLAERARDGPQALRVLLAAAGQPLTDHVAVMRSHVKDGYDTYTLGLFSEAQGAVPIARTCEVVLMRTPEGLPMVASGELVDRVLGRRAVCGGAGDGVEGDGGDGVTGEAGPAGGGVGAGHSSGSESRCGEVAERGVSGRGGEVATAAGSASGMQDVEAAGDGACAAGGGSTVTMGLVWKQLSPTDLNRGYLLRLGAGSELFGPLVSAVVGSVALQPAASGGAGGEEAPAVCHSYTAVREQLNLPVKLVPEGFSNGRFQVGAHSSRMAAQKDEVLHGLLGAGLHAVPLPLCDGQRPMPCSSQSWSPLPAT